MSSVRKEDVLAALRGIVDPARQQDIVSAGMVSGLTIEGDRVRFIISVDPERGQNMQPLATAAERAVLDLPEVRKAIAILTAHSDSGAGQNPRAADNVVDFNPSKSGPTPVHASASSAPPGTPIRQGKKSSGPIDNVANVIAIASGKGGVGKSTVAANLAVALAAEGRRVGLLDADVYGPSQPRMLGVSGRPSSPDGQTILPLRNHGVTLMSIGLMMPEDKATIWRGPMLMGALQQMLHQVAWGRLDVLLVDLPPGTGDVQLTLAQKTEVTGAIIVSTPQDVALLDAKKALDMFEKTETPILGMIENMSIFCCPNCGHETDLFGRGGARAEAERVSAPFLGEIPLDLDVRVAGDGGVPIVVSAPESPQAKRFREIANTLITREVA